MNQLRIQLIIKSKIQGIKADFDARKLQDDLWKCSTLNYDAYSKLKLINVHLPHDKYVHLKPIQTQYNTTKIRCVKKRDPNCAPLIDCRTQRLLEDSIALSSDSYDSIFKETQDQRLQEIPFTEEVGSPVQQFQEIIDKVQELPSQSPVAQPISKVVITISSDNSVACLNDASDFNDELSEMLESKTQTRQQQLPKYMQLQRSFHNSPSMSLNSEIPQELINRFMCDEHSDIHQQSFMSFDSKTPFIRPKAVVPPRLRIKFNRKFGGKQADPNLLMELLEACDNDIGTVESVLKNDKDFIRQFIVKKIKIGV